MVVGLAAAHEAALAEDALAVLTEVEALDAEADEMVRERCLMPPAVNAVRHVRFHSGQTEANLFYAVTVSEAMAAHGAILAEVREVLLNQVLLQRL